jgi:O-antigen ligase
MSKGKKTRVSARRLNLYLIHLLVFVLPFEATLIPPVLILFVLTNLFSHSWNERVRFFNKRKKFILMFSSLYLLNIVALLYTTNMSAGLFQLEVQASLLLVPLVILTSNVVNRFTLPEILKTYVIGILVAFAVCVIQSIIAFSKHGDPVAFYYNEFSFFMHPGYFAMYANLALSIMIIYIFHSKNKVMWKYYLAMACLIVLIFQLNSRTGLIVLVGNMIYGALILIFPTLKWRRQLATYLAAALITTGVLYTSYSYFKISRVSKISAEATNANSSFGSRLAMWQSSLDLVKQQPLFGYAPGDAKDVMQSKFREDRLVYAVAKNLNVHNQYFQVIIGLGIVGLIALLVPMLVPIYHSLKGTNYLYVLFVSNIGLNFITESMLEKQAGTIFYAVTWCILYFTWKD